MILLFLFCLKGCQKQKKPFELAEGTKGFYLHDNLKRKVAHRSRNIYGIAVETLATIFSQLYDKTIKHGKSISCENQICNKSIV